MRDNPAGLVKAGDCVFSKDRKYRYQLWRKWDMANDLVADHGGSYGRAKGSFLMVIGLNPSTADENKNDPTVTRCIDFAMRWGFDSLCMMNAFAYRATDPKAMQRTFNPIGDKNDIHLTAVMIDCHRSGGIILGAWGNHGRHMNRGRAIRQMARAFACVPLHSLGTTKYGEPRHPLYLSAELLPQAYP